MNKGKKDSVRGSVRASTHASYEQQVGRYIIPAIGRIKLGKLTPAHVQHLYRGMQDRGLSARTVQYTHAVLRRALKQAKRWGMVDRNVAEDVDPPRLKRDEIQSVDREQTRRLLARWLPRVLGPSPYPRPGSAPRA